MRQGRAVVVCRRFHKSMGKSPNSIAALIGFALASASTLLAVWLRSYGYAIGGFRHYDPLLLAGFRTGMGLSAAASVFAIVGLRQPNRLRWLGLGWALLGLLFWVGTALME
jgi:hypothetical protein